MSKRLHEKLHHRRMALELRILILFFTSWLALAALAAWWIAGGL